ncbi:S-adenosylmethionine uptake transporter [Rickettsiales bacterium]|nr:S-adenosylmethionine uptake transporter [Rickettsiales bacterium]
MINNATKGIAWFVACIFFSDLSDIIAKYLAQDLHFYQITFSKFIFSILTLVPFLPYKQTLKTKIVHIHLIRGALLYIATVIWFAGLKFVQLNTAIAIGFSVPLFNILLSFYILKESVQAATLFALITGFAGVIIVVDPQGINAQPAMLIMLLSSIIYAYLDILNKKFSSSESALGMIFYSNLFSAALALIPCLLVWQTPSIKQLVFMFILGLNESLFLYCILKAFTLENLSFLAPFYYIELLTSGLLGYLIFAETPKATSIVGGSIILLGIIFSAHSRIKKLKTG